MDNPICSMDKEDAVVILVPPDRIGFVSPAGFVVSGEILSTVSCQTIAEESRLRGVFELDGNRYALTGASYHGAEATGWGYEIVPLDQFKGETHTYQDVSGSVLENGRYVSRFTFDGMRVKFQGKDVVLIGPKLEFKPDGPLREEPRQESLF